MQSRPKGFRDAGMILVIILSSVFLLAAFSKPDPSLSKGGLRVSAEPQTCGECWPCQGGTGHWVEVSIIPIKWGFHSCFIGTYCSSHSPCISQFGLTDSVQSRIREERLLAFFDAAVWGSSAASATLVTEFPDRVYLNSDRHALQVLACDGEAVIGHLVLESNEYAYLAEVSRRSFALQTGLLFTSRSDRTYADGSQKWFP